MGGALLFLREKKSGGRELIVSKSSHASLRLGTITSSWVVVVIVVAVLLLLDF